MKLEEVVKQNKPFRRPNFKPYMNKTIYLKINDYSRNIVFENTANIWTPRIEDLTADDWEIKVEKRELSLEQIIKAIDNATIHSIGSKNFTDNYKKQLAIFLGFEDEKVEVVVDDLPF